MKGHVMMRNRLAMVALLLLALAPNERTASAQTSNRQRASLTPVRYEAKTRYDFDDDTVEGDLARSDHSWVEARRRAKYPSLIRMRTDFIPELIKSADSL
jgi:hypothetical protein